MAGMYSGTRLWASISSYTVSGIIAEMSLSPYFAEFMRVLGSFSCPYVLVRRVVIQFTITIKKTCHWIHRDFVALWVHCAQLINTL